ncbi:MAG: HAD family phosphatase [Flavobacteriales bacterium]|nr:HAD family phosphatase [Flavobacteriales bacterium]
MIDTLLLDLGGVLIDVDYHRTARAFGSLGFGRFEELYSKAQQDHLFDGFETGALSPQQFRDRIRSLMTDRITDEEIDTCWNAMLGSIPNTRMHLVASLRKRYRVLLLSNTNAIHVPAFSEIIQRENGINDFKTCFDGAYYSCELGLRKPNADAFLQVLAMHGAEPNRTLFIDDSVQHVIGARAAGLQAEHLELAQEDFIGMIERLGLL